MRFKEPKFKLKDKVKQIKNGDDRIGKVVELNTFKPDGHEGCTDWGRNTCGVVWGNSQGAIYHFEDNLIKI